MDGEAVAVIEGGQMYYIRTDHIGRPVFATDSTGAKVWEAMYLPFGGVHTTTGTPIKLRFPGQWFQSEAGLHQNWMRDYDPTTGRYMQAEPLGLVDGASVYGYVRQNPGRYSDPTGQCPWCVGAAVGAGTNLFFQTVSNYLKYGSFLTALKCVDIKDVVLSGAFGAIGASPLKAFKSKRFGAAVGIAAVSTFTKKITVPTPIRVGDECECNGGQKPDGWKGKFTDFVDAVSPHL